MRHRLVVMNYEKINRLQSAWLDSFRLFVSNSKFGWVHIDPVPISEIIGDESVAESERLIGLLSAFDAPPTPIETIMQSNSNSQSGLEVYAAHFGGPFRDSTYNLWNACFGASGSELLAPWESV